MAVDPAERLLNLIIALTHARVRMTRAQIRSSVAGYAPPTPGRSDEEARREDAAFERMFERDKDELRRIGIPLKTVVDPTHGDEIGYKIDASDAKMPDIEFNSAEMAALALASEYWRGATLGPDANQGLTKVASTAGAAPRTPLGLGARATSLSDATAVIAEARARRQAVEFEYTSESTGHATRTVEPWLVLIRGGADYLVGFDRDKQAARTFRLRRVHGDVRAIGPDNSYEIPDPIPPAGSSPAPVKVGRIGLRPEAGHALREQGTVVGSDGDWDVLDVEYRYADQLRDAVLGLGGRARIVEPADIADRVIEFAQAALDAAAASLGEELNG